MTAPDPGPRRRETSTAHPVHSETPERRLWAEALAQLVRDGILYWRRGSGGNHELEQAFDDLCRAGPMTRHICGMLEMDAEAVSRQFIRYCERQ